MNNFVLSPADMVQIGSDITSVPDSPPGGRKSTVVSALRILGGHDSGGVFFSLHGQMIFSHPVIELDKICHKLGSRHELTEPRSAKLLGSGEECLGFFWIDQRVDRRVRIAYVPVSPLPSRPILPVPGVRFLPLRSLFWHPRYSLPPVRSVPPAHARHSVPVMPVWSPSPYSASYMLPHSAETRFPPDPSSDGMPPALLLQG